MIVLETERVFVRQWVPDDWKRLRPVANDPRVLEFIGDAEAWPDERIRRFVNGGIEKAMTRGWILWPVICKEDSELMGFCGFNDGFLPEVEIGWRLAPAYWGRGIATEAARAVMRYGFEKFKFPRVISVAQAQNRPSIRVMEKLGMTLDESFRQDGLDLVRYVKPNPSALRAVV